jgi:hypothetical protein
MLRFHRKTQSDMDYVLDKGTLIVGLPIFAPMDYKTTKANDWLDANGHRFAKTSRKCEFVEDRLG